MMTENDVSSSTNPNMMNMADNNGGDMMGVYNMMGPMVGPMSGPMGGDPNMMMNFNMNSNMNPMNNMNQMNQMNFNNFGGMLGPDGAPMMGGMGGPIIQSHWAQMAVKEVINLKSSVLYPPPVGAPPRSVRDRPPGCRTIFVGGIPANSTEELLFEVFEGCGSIQSIRISKKNFAHIRFEHMNSVDAALFISGYRMKIGDSDEKEDTGRLHVDFAQARDDQYEYECQQRALAREMRHYQRMEEERNRPPSPPPVVLYSEHEGAQLLENLKTDENFTSASQALINWLERGECNRRSSNQFYAMVQKCYNQVQRLNNDQQTVESEYEQYKIQYHQRLVDIRGQVCQVERVLQAAHKQKCWDHFTKAQRKNIDTWLRQAQEARKKGEADQNQSKTAAVNEDMDLDEDLASSPAKKPKVSSTYDYDPKSMQEAAQAWMRSEGRESINLKEENDTLKCQMEAFKNEMDMVRQEGIQEAEDRKKQITALQNALQGMQQQLMTQRALAAAATAKEKEALAKEKKALAKAKAATDKAAKARAKLSKEKDDKDASETEKKSTEESETSSDSKKEENTEKTEETDEEEEEPEVIEVQDEETVSSSGLNLTEKEAKMIGLICCFLHVHPHGATVDYLWSYLQQLITVRTRDVEDLLEKVPSLFTQEIHGVGAAIERRWIFSALSRNSASSSI